MLLTKYSALFTILETPNMFLNSTPSFLCTLRGEGEFFQSLLLTNTRSLRQVSLSLSLRQRYLSLRQRYPSLRHRSLSQTEISLSQIQISLSQADLSLPDRDLSLSQTEISLSQTHMYHPASPKFVISAMNRVPVAHLGFILGEDGAAASRLFKYLPGLFPSVWGPKKSKNAENQKF